MNRREHEQNALEAADRCLKSRGWIAFVDVFCELGFLSPEAVKDWRFGRVPILENVIRLNLSKINAICRAVHANARRAKLRASGTAYVRWRKGPRVPLRFTKSGNPDLERAWATHYLLPKKSGGADPTAKNHEHRTEK